MDASANTPVNTTDNSHEEELTGEDAVRRAASVIVNRSSGEGDAKRVRRRSRKARNTPLLAGGGLQFHYLVGILMVLLFPILIFRDKISSNVWKLLHPPTPLPTTGGPSGPIAHAGPPPWWFHPDVLALFLALLVWLYLTPGVWDRVKMALGLKKDKENRSRRRHS